MRHLRYVVKIWFGKGFTGYSIEAGDIQLYLCGFEVIFSFFFSSILLFLGCHDVKW